MNRAFFNMLARKSQIVEPVEVHALKFEGTEVFTLSTVYQNWDGSMEYSVDGTTWSTWDGSEIGGYTVLYVRGIGNTYLSTGSPAVNRTVFSFSTSGLISAYGRIDYLLDWETVKNGGEVNVGVYTFYSLFRNSSHIIKTPDFPSYITSNQCYGYMFYGCTSLTLTSDLTATLLSDSGCYYSMFYGCTNLKIPPRIYATTLNTACCRTMFYECTSLKVSETETGNYTYPWRIPHEGEISASATNWSLDMLSGTGGTFTGDPNINTTYYLDIQEEGYNADSDLDDVALDLEGDIPVELTP